MGKLLWQRIAPMLAEANQVVLATCGDHGPTASAVSLLVQDESVWVLLPDSSEHLFNLQRRAEVVLLSPHWELHGSGAIARSGSAALSRPWLVLVQIMPACLHILSDHGTHNVETIDFVD